MTPEDWAGLLVEATERVREKVAAIALEGERGKTVGVGASGDRTIVADKVAEDILLEALGRTGDVGVLSEEAGRWGKKDARTLAIVDPLDGSSNFERGVPFYCTSVAMAEGPTLDDLTLGVIRDLVSGDVFVGRRGEGATKNGKPIRTGEVARVAEAVVGADISRGSADVMRRVSPVISGAKRQVHFGANALELCLLADGRMDAFVDIRGKMRITDFAAAYLIAGEAGAVVTDEEGGAVRPAFDLSGRFSYIASANLALHKEILRLVGESQGQR